MNEAHKKALRIHHKDLIQDLDLTADLAGKLIHTGILNEDMIEEIKHEKTRKERVQKLLLILPRRGPRAFDKFVCALNDHYPWLADALRKTYHKISLHTEPEMLSLKKKVDIYVHERFGNSKRLCEDDKKEIRHFLYSYLKSHKEEDDPLFAVEQSRRGSLESNASDIKHLHAVSEKDIEVNVLLSRVYSMFGDDKSDETEDFDNVDGPADITIDMIEKKVKDFVKQVDTLQNEIKNCYAVLEIEKSEQPLNKVLETIRDDRIVERKRLGRLRDKLNLLEQQRNKLEQHRSELEEKMRNKQRELNDALNNLADSEHMNEKSEALSQELKEKCDKLKDKCDKLEQLHVKHVEKQQTLMTLKSMVSELTPVNHNNDPGWFNKRGEREPASVQLPKLSPVRVNRQGRQSHAGTIRDRSPTHHEFPKPRTSHNGMPWK